MRIKEQTVYKEGNFEITCTTIDDVYNVDEYEEWESLKKRFGIETTKQSEVFKKIGESLFGGRDFDWDYVAYQPITSIPKPPEMVIREWDKRQSHNYKFVSFQTSQYYVTLAFYEI